MDESKRLEVEEHISDLKEAYLYCSKDQDENGRFIIPLLNFSEYLIAIQNYLKLAIKSSSEYEFTKTAYSFKDLVISMDGSTLKVSGGLIFEYKDKLNYHCPLLKFKNCILSGKWCFKASLALKDSQIDYLDYEIPEKHSALNYIFLNNVIIENLFVANQEEVSDSVNLIINDSSIKIIECEDIHFQQLHVKNSRLRNLNFNNAVFAGTTKFVNCKFLKAPKFHDTKFHSDTRFQNCVFLDIDSGDAERDYASLKHSMRNISSDIDAERFQALEIKSRINAYKGDGLLSINGNRIEYWCAKFMHHFNDFGQNLLLPLVNILELFVIFSALYFLCPYVLGGHDAEISDYIWFSLRNSFGPFGLALNTGLESLTNNRWYVFWGFVQLIISSIMWFLYVMQVRRRFRM